MKQCSECKEWKDSSEFTKSEVTKDGLRYNCKECESIRWKLWYRANKEHKKQSDTDYRKANPDKMHEYNKTYRAKNPGKSSETSRTWHKNHPEQSKIKHIEDARRWRENNPDEHKARLRRRRAQKLGSGGSHTVTQWIALCNHYDNKCLACGEPKPLTEDHIVPLSKGGSDDISNIQPLCISCNARKKDQTIDYRY